MEIKDLQTEFRQITEEHGLKFDHKPVEGAEKLYKLVMRAFIAGRRKARRELMPKALPPEVLEGLK